jgi:hypothetical protein
MDEQAISCSDSSLRWDRELDPLRVDPPELERARGRPVGHERVGSAGEEGGHQPSPWADVAAPDSEHSAEERIEKPLVDETADLLITERQRQQLRKRNDAKLSCREPGDRLETRATFSPSRGTGVARVGHDPTVPQIT